MPSRIYPIIHSKICIVCNQEFKRKKNYFGKQWQQVTCCSYECARQAMSKTNIEKYKDETKHPRWKGDKVGYYGVHDWITKHYGQPKQCINCGLKDVKRVYHWANISLEYKRDIGDWRRLCVSCHRLYDYSRPFNKLSSSS